MSDSPCPTGPGRYDDRFHELEGHRLPGSKPTSAGPSDVTWNASSACWPARTWKSRPLVSGAFPMHDAVSVYADLSSGALKAVGVLLEYPAPDPEHQPRSATSLVRAGVPAAPATVSRGPNGPASKRLAIGFIGAGNYASSMLLPHLAQLPDAQLTHVATTRSLSAVNATAAVRLHYRLDQRRRRYWTTSRWTRSSW